MNEGILQLAWPAGTWFWHVSRVAGVTAYVALALNVLFGLFLSTAVADRLMPRARSIEIHRLLSSIGLWLTLTHALALLGDRYVTFELLDLLVPFAGPYRPVAVGLGSLAAWTAVAVHASFWLKGHIGQRTWRALHFLSFAVFVLAAIHGITAGTDTPSLGMKSLYWVSCTLVLWLTLYRVAVAVMQRKRAAAAVAPLRAGVALDLR